MCGECFLAEGATTIDQRPVGDVFRDPDSGILVRVISLDPYQIEPIFIWSKRGDDRMTYFNRRNIDIEPYEALLALALKVIDDGAASLTITVSTWFPAPPENRRLPMPLKYA